MIVRARRRSAFLQFSVARAVVGLTLAASVACSREESPSASADPASSSAAAKAGAPARAPETRTTPTTALPPDGGKGASSGRTGSLVLARGVRFAKPGAGDVAKLVKAERENAAADGRDLIVYVGATWCEPCQRFHHAAEAGELDADFPGLTILAFDLDQDRDRLVDAGYDSKLIPLFVVPGADGRATERRFEGSVKGDRAVTNIAPRLRAILAK